MLGAFTIDGIKDGAVLVVRMASGLDDGGISVTAGLRLLSRVVSRFEVHWEFVFVHGLVFVSSYGGRHSNFSENGYETGSGL